MVTPTYPGVYVQEVSSGVRPIAAASTSTAAFIGQAERGSVTDAVRIFNFTEFQNLYGGFLDYSYLAHAVFQFFNNGGSICYVVRVTGEGTETASLTLADQADTPGETMILSAASPGEWGNELEVVITDGTVNPNTEFNIAVYEGDAPAPVEVFENLTMIETAPNFVETRINASPRLRVSVNDANPSLAAAFGTSRGSAAPTLTDPLAPPQTRLRISINGDVAQEVDLSTATASLDTAANVATAITEVVNALAPVSASVPPEAYSDFTATVDTGVLLLTSGVAGTTSSVTVLPASNGDNDVTGILNLGAAHLGVETTGAAITRPQTNPAPADRYMIGDHTVGGAVLAVVAGSDGAPVTDDPPFVNALSRLDDKNDVSLISIPGIASPFVFGEATAYCENRSLSDCFYIGEMMRDFDTVDEATNEFAAMVSPKNSYGAVYMPWVMMPDPTGASPDPIAVPPSGFIAGLYAKTDNQRGVWKAPAGTAAALAGTTGLYANLTDVQQGLLNPINVNVIRDFPAAGRVIWGARTLTSDPEWLYVPVRRMAIFLRVSIYNGIQWAVFEPNDEPLWANLRLNLNAFMGTLFRRGAFQGATASEAYFVKVDSETTTQADIDAGIVNIQIGFAPLKPAEFVIVQISQKAGQSA